MNHHDRDLVELANKRRDSNVGAGDLLVGQSEALKNLFRHVWPKKTAVHLSIAADVTIRQAERYLAGDQPFGWAVTCRLLRSEIGGDILEIIMEGAKPEWWLVAFHERRIAKARRERKEADKRLKALEDDA